MIRVCKKMQYKTGLAMNWKKSSNSGHLGWKSRKIRGFQSFCFVRDTNMTLKNRVRTFAAR